MTADRAIKEPCRLATTANITLSGLQTIDGVTTVAGDRVLVRAQTTGSANGIYTAASGAWSRDTDFDSAGEVVGGTQVSVTAGTLNAGSYWRVVGSGPRTIGTDSIQFEPGVAVAAWVGYTFPDSDALARTVGDKLDETVSLLDFIPASLHASIRASTCQTILTSYFDQALAYVQSLPAGGEIYIPPGTYAMDMNLTDASAGFLQRIRIRGAGRRVTRIFPSGYNTIILNLLGRNFVEVCDLTIKAGQRIDTSGPYVGYASSCGIYLSRSTDSPNCNNNKFINVEVEGNYINHAVVSCAAESSLWLNCQFKPSAGSFSAFWTGSDPLFCGVTPPAGTPVAGPNTDNKSIGCEFYVPFPNARPLTISRAGGWTFIGAGLIVANVENARLVTFKDPDNGSFNGPIQFRDCQFEIFGARNVIFYLDETGTSGSNTWYGIHTSGGYAVVDNNIVFLDYDRTAIANQPGLSGCVLEMPEVPSGDTLGNPISTGLPLYAYFLLDCRVHWRTRDGNGLAVVFGFAARTMIDALETRIAQLVNWDAPYYSDAVPTSGTFAKGQRVFRSPGASIAAGDVEGWICSTSGTMGTLNGGATTANTNSMTDPNKITVNSATDLKVGQLITIASNGSKRVKAINGTTVYVDSDCTTTVTGAAVSFSNGAFLQMGVIGQVAAQADSTATTVADLKSDFNALLVKLRAAKIQAP